MGLVNIRATVSPLVPAGTRSPLQLSSPSQIRLSKLFSGSDNLAQQLALDLENIKGTVNDLHKNQQSSPAITQLLLTNAAGQVIAAFGPTTYQGVTYTNYLSEIHVGNPLKTQNPQMALFNANLDGSVSIGQNGWIDVHDPWEGNAAWIGTQYDSVVITNAVNNGAGAIRLTVPGHTMVAPGNLQTAVRNLNLWNVPNGNGTWTVTVINASTIDLNDSVWSGPYGFVDADGDVDPVPDMPAGIPTYLATIQRWLQIASVTKPASVVEIETTIPHTYETGDQVYIPLPATAIVVSQWTLTVVDPTHFTLDDSNSASGGDFAGAATCLRYYAGVLAKTIAIGDNFPGYKLRAFANGDLKIRNASIELSSTAGASIQIDPATARITLAASSPSLAKIVLDATVPAITLYNSLGTMTITINSDGTFILPGAISFTAALAKLTGLGSNGSITFVNGIATAYSAPT